MDRKTEIYYLLIHEGLIASRISDRLGIGRSGISKQIKKLLNEGAIKKAENLLPTDPNFAEFRYAICEADMFHKLVEKQVKKKNMMDPTKEFMEPVNTPGYMSPSSETYWSM